MGDRRGVRPDEFEVKIADSDVSMTDRKAKDHG
jgi:hypothetical protein